MTRLDGSRVDQLLLRAAGSLWDHDSSVRRVIGVAGLGAIIYGVTAALPVAGPPGQRVAVLVLTALGSVLFLAWLAINRSVTRAVVAVLVLQC